MREYSKQIEKYILENVESHPSDIGRITGEQFGISRMSIARHLRNLVAKRQITATGNTKARKYELKSIVADSFKLDVTSNLEEDIIWRERALPLMNGIRENVLNICQYGFTEMLNNVISHSDSNKVLISITRNAINVSIMVADYGVGIFKRIQTAFNYDDPRHALLELSKGKLTSDQEVHTGEGIFDVLSRVKADNLKLNWDPANYCQTGLVPFPDAYEVVRDYVAHVHVKNVIVMGAFEKNRRKTYKYS